MLPFCPEQGKIKVSIIRDRHEQWSNKISKVSRSHLLEALTQNGDNQSLGTLGFNVLTVFDYTIKICDKRLTYVSFGFGSLLLEARNKNFD